MRRDIGSRVALFIAVSAGLVTLGLWIPTPEVLGLVDVVASCREWFCNAFGTGWWPCS